MFYSVLLLLVSVLFSSHAAVSAETNQNKTTQLTCIQDLEYSDQRDILNSWNALFTWLEQTEQAVRVKNFLKTLTITEKPTAYNIQFSATKQLSLSTLYFALPDGELSNLDIQALKRYGNEIIQKIGTTQIYILISPFGEGHAHMAKQLPTNAILLGGTRFSKSDLQWQWVNSVSFSYLPGLEVQSLLFPFDVTVTN